MDIDNDTLKIIADATTDLTNVAMSHNDEWDVRALSNEIFRNFLKAVAEINRPSMHIGQIQKTYGESPVTTMEKSFGQEFETNLQDAYEAKERFRGSIKWRLVNRLYNYVTIDADGTIKTWDDKPVAAEKTWEGRTACWVVMPVSSADPLLLKRWNLIIAERPQ